MYSDVTKYLISVVHIGPTRSQHSCIQHSILALPEPAFPKMSVIGRWCGWGAIVYACNYYERFLSYKMACRYAKKYRSYQKLFQANQQLYESFHYKGDCSSPNSWYLVTRSLYLNLTHFITYRHVYYLQKFVPNLWPNSTQR